jgi:hypothetical protein
LVADAGEAGINDTVLDAAFVASGGVAVAAGVQGRTRSDMPIDRFGALEPLLTIWPTGPFSGSASRQA